MTDEMPVCPVCALNDGVRPLYPGLSIYRCAGCTHVFYFSPNVSEEASDVYDGDYFKGKEYFDYTAEKPALVKNFKGRLGEVRRYRASGRLIEIGCAYGYFLELARAYFGVEGVEVVEEAVRSARDELGLNVFHGDYLERPEEKEAFDAVCMWDAIEHLTDPKAVVEKAYRELRPGGVIALSTGDVSSLPARVRKERWRLIHPPSHLHYFSEGSIKRLLCDANFDVADITYPGNYRSLGAVFYNLFVNDMRSGTRSASRFMDRVSKVLAHATFYLNMRDIMVVIATKGGR